MRDPIHQAFALAVVARGFANQGDDAQAGDLLGDLRARLSAISDPSARARVWTFHCLASIARHRYGDVQPLGSPTFADLSPDQQLPLFAQIVRDRAERQNPALREQFERPRVGIGRLGLDWQSN